MSSKLTKVSLHKAAFESLSIAAYVWLSLTENMGQKMLHLPFCWNLSMTLKYAKNAFAFAAGALRLRPTTLPRLPGWLGEENPLPIPYSPRRNLRAFGARYSAPQLRNTTAPWVLASRRPPALFFFEKSNADLNDRYSAYNYNVLTLML